MQPRTRTRPTRKDGVKEPETSASASAHLITLGIATTVAVGVLSIPGRGGEPQGPFVPPNFLVVLVDDLGIDQLSQYAASSWYTSQYPYANTPFFDQMAMEGVQFNQARAYPTCSPSRFALHTGRYAFRTGVGSIVNTNNMTAAFAEPGVPPSPPITTTLADILNAKGYATGMFGKLHLQLETSDGGTGPAYGCSVLGFDSFEGIRGNVNSPPQLPGGVSGSYRAYEPVSCAAPVPTTVATEYITNRQRDDVIQWIRERKGPWFALWNTNDIHGPYDWPSEVRDPVVDHGFGITAPDGGTAPLHLNTRIRAKLEHLDRQIRRVWESVPKEMEKNTYLIVLGDNGTPSHAFNASDPSIDYPPNHPSCNGCGNPVAFAPYDPTRVKGSTYEGGVRIPLLVLRGGFGKPVMGSQVDGLVDIVDVFETLNELSSAPGAYTAEPDAVDSISFAPYLRGTVLPVDEPRTFSHSAVFSPNGTMFFPPGPVRYHQYYLRKDGANLWKMVYKIDPGATPGTFTESWEFFDVGTNPNDVMNLNSPTNLHPEFVPTVIDWYQLVTS